MRSISFQSFKKERRAKEPGAKLGFDNRGEQSPRFDGGEVS